MFIEVRLATDVRPNAVVIAEDAVLPLQGANFVWVVIDGKATRRQVELGVRTPGFVEARTGVEAGEQVVVGGQERLAEGAPAAPTVVDRTPASGRESVGGTRRASRHCRQDNRRQARATAAEDGGDPEAGGPEAAVAPRGRGAGWPCRPRCCSWSAPRSARRRRAPSARSTARPPPTPTSSPFSIRSATVAPRSAGHARAQPRGAGGPVRRRLPAARRRARRTRPGAASRWSMSRRTSTPAKWRGRRPRRCCCAISRSARSRRCSTASSCWWCRSTTWTATRPWRRATPTGRDRTAPRSSGAAPTARASTSTATT